jgi:O-antigen ligase
VAYRPTLPSWIPTAALLSTAALIGLITGINPKYGIVAVLALGFVAVVMADLTLGLCLFTVVTFLDILPTVGVAVTFAKAVGVLLVISWLGSRSQEASGRREFFGVHPALTYLVVAFLVWGLASMVWAEDPSAVFSAMFRYGLNVLLFVIVFAAVRSERAVLGVVIAFLIGAIASAGYGFAFPVDQSSVDEISRLGGLGADPNQLASVLVCGIVLAAALVVGDNSPPLRLFALGTIVLCAAGVLFSFSRTGLVALAVALVAGVIFGGRWRRWAVVLLVVLSVGMTTYILSFAGEQQRERVTKLDGGTGRSDIWTVGERMIRHSPLNGVGAGNFPISSVHYLLQPGVIERPEFIVDTPKVAHNIFIEVWAELGLVGLVMFLTIIGSAVGFAGRAALMFKRNGDERMELLARAIVVSQVAFLSAGLFLSEEFSKQLWLLLALGPALFAIAQAAERPRDYGAA